jgi:hypothetical protein
MCLIFALQGPSSLITFDANYPVWLQNCASYEVTIETGDIVGSVKVKETELLVLNDQSIVTVCKQIYD